MADILITAVSASYSGSEQADDIRNGTGNLRDVTVLGLSGDDLLSIGSAVQAGTGNGGAGLGFSLGSSNLNLGAGADTLTFSGQAGSGFAQFRNVSVALGSEADFAYINGLASASASVVRGNEGDDEITFSSINTAGAATAFDVRVNGNAGDDSISATWTGTEARNFVVLAGQGADTLDVTFSAVSAHSTAERNESGAKVGGNKGDDIISVDIQGASDNVRVNGNSGADTITVSATNVISTFDALGGRGDDEVTVNFSGSTANGSKAAGNLGDDVVTVNANDNFFSALTIEGDSGADSLVLNVTGNVTAATGNAILGGSGTDTLSLNLASAGTFIGTGETTGASAFVMNLGAESTGGTINVELAQGSQIAGASGMFAQGSDSADTITYTLATGSQVGGMMASANAGADTIAVTVASGGQFDGGLFGGSGADVITGNANIATSGGLADFAGMTAGGGSGNDTLAFTFTAATGVVAGALEFQRSEVLFGAVQGGAGADSITMLAAFAESAATAQSINLGVLNQGGDGNDTITLGAANVSTGDAFFIKGAFEGGAGSDSLVIEGAVTITGEQGVTFLGANTGGSAGFVFNSGDSEIASFDVISVNTVDTGSQRGGTFGSAGIVFQNYTGNNLADFNMQLSQGTAGGIEINSAGGNVSGGQALIVGSAGGAVGSTGGAIVATGGVLSLTTGGGAGLGAQGMAFLISGGSTTGQVFSAVNTHLNGVRGAAVAFNVMNGSGGSVDGYIYVEGGGGADTVFKVEGNGTTGQLTGTQGIFAASGGGVNGILLDDNRESGGTIYFGQNIGVGL